MKKLLLAALLGMLLTASQARADGSTYGPCRIDAGINAHFNVYTGNAYLPMAPWYTYWPYDGHTLSPGPLYTASQWQVFPGGNFINAPPPRVTYPQAPMPSPAPRSAIRPVSYNSGAPGYWYGQ